MKFISVDELGFTFWDPVKNSCYDIELSYMYLDIYVQDIFFEIMFMS